MGEGRTAEVIYKSVQYNVTFYETSGDELMKEFATVIHDNNRLSQLIVDICTKVVDLWELLRARDVLV